MNDSLLKNMACVCVAAAALAITPVTDVDAKDPFRIVTVAKGLAHPWGLAFLPDGRMLVTERVGRLRIVSADGRLSPPVKGLPKIAAVGQGGLLDVVLHPKFSENKLIYMSFSESGDGGVGTAVVRGRFENDRLEEAKIIFRQKPKLRGGRHFGSRLVFAPDGTLYVSMGDRGEMKQAQDPSNHVGTVARINDDGSVPTDNPFVGKKSHLPEIYTYGNRNVQGMALNPVTGVVWAHEHGPQGGDELNILKAGVNYGWPAITYGVDYGGAVISKDSARPGMEQPVIHWTPSIAPSGMAFYTGDKFPEWKGNIFVGALKYRQLRRLVLNGDAVVEQHTLLAEFDERIRDVRSGPDGYIYVLTDDSEGVVARLEPR